VTNAARHLPALLLVACLAAVYPTQRWIDESGERERAEEEALYVTNGTSLRRMSLGYEAMLADVYWMRLIQYFGRKVLDDPTVLSPNSDRLALLYPLTQIITDLDPRHTAAYRFGGFFVHDYVDQVKGFAILNKAVENNPREWQLYQDLGFLYWTDGRCQEAAGVYARASEIPGAPAWMPSLAATVLADCGNVETARAMYEHMLEVSDDPRILYDVRRKLLELQALDEVAALREAVAAFRERTGRNPASLAEVRPAVEQRRGGSAPAFDQRGLPVDPNGVPYLYDPATGDVAPDPASLRLPRGLVRRKADT
jgi:tetratricopeptide (TPR) repeat protein